MSLVKVENLVKVYGKRVAVDHVTFRIEEGEIFGLLGPNGAGRRRWYRYYPASSLRLKAMPGLGKRACAKTSWP